MATILAVDDSPSVRQMVKLVLGGSGHTVTEACDGSDGLAKASAQKFDLILTDLNMPVMNGIEMIRGLRKMPALNGVPIVFITTESDDGAKQEAKAAGATVGSPSLSSRSSSTPSWPSWCARDGTRFHPDGTFRSRRMEQSVPRQDRPATLSSLNPLIPLVRHQEQPAMRLTIRTKLLASFGLVLALSAGAGTLAYVKLTRLATAQSTASELMGRVDAIGDLTAAVQSAALARRTPSS